MRNRHIKKERLTLDTAPASIYGSDTLFNLCGNADLMSLSFEGQQPLLDWIGWELTDEYLINRNFITWMRPEYSEGSPTAGFVADPCADPSGVDYGTCDFTLTDFARLRRGGPVRDITVNDIRYCQTQPRYRLDGTSIMDNREYDIRLVTEVLLQDLKRMLMNGNSSTPGQFNGLQRLIKTGYTNTDGKSCSIMDSIVIDWNDNPMSGGNGITWNGAAVASTYNLIDVLLAVFRRIIQRIKMAPSLAAQQMALGNMILAMPSTLIQCILNHYTCWSVCDGSQYNEVALQSYEARNFRNGLLGGLFGYGRIYLDGFEIPLLGYDWGTISGPTRGDIYFLTGAIGSVKLIQGQLLNMASAAQKESGKFAVTDGGRLLHWAESDHTCVQIFSEIRPRLVMWAPWAQARIQDVQCNQPGGMFSADPTETSFFPETSFFSAGS